MSLAVLYLLGVEFYVFPSYCTTVITPSFTGVKILVDLNPHNSCVVRAGVLRLKHMLHCPTRSLDVASATLDQF